MAAFGKYIANLVQQSGKPAYEFAARMGIGDTHLSGIIKGKRLGINRETLAKMVSGISDDPIVQSGLLEAYFKDLALPDMKDWVSVAPPTRLTEVPPRYGSDDVDRLAKTLRRLDLPTPLVNSLTRLVELMENHHALQDLVTDLADFAEDALAAGKRQPTRNSR